MSHTYPEALLAIQQEGATARVTGAGYFDNPYYQKEAMPRLTGESPEDWTAKAMAWELGWTMEDEMRAAAEGASR